MVVPNYSRKDIVKLGEKVYAEVGGSKGLINRVKRYGIVPKTKHVIHNFYYVYQDVYDYGDLNTTLTLAMLYLAYQQEDRGKTLKYGKR